MTTDREREREESADRLTHWPHSAHRCKTHLDLGKIEGQAVRILARGLRTQRLVAFVGAGASMAYGRLTWSELTSALFTAIDSSGNADWERIRNDLWPNGLTDFLDSNEHPLKLQILSNAWSLDKSGSDVRVLPGSGEPAPLTDVGLPDSGLLDERRVQRETVRLLKDFHGFVDWLVQNLKQPGSPAPSSRESRENHPAKAGSSEIDENCLSAVLDQIKKIKNWLKENNPKPVGNIINALREKSIREDSPVRQLALDWGIRRFMTTNYDREIELGLKALSFKELTRQREVHQNQYETLNFGRKNTGDALRFALEGPRRHAAVLHLHGDVADPASLIVTESDYQHLYLDDHPLRDLVTNATLANFAANPMLFVGSEVSEEDVLRPMRQFMSGPGHRSDRMAVALFPATKAPAKRALQAANLLLKYGVYAIHVGRVGGIQPYTGTYPDLMSDSDDRIVPDNWLHLLYDAIDKLKKSYKNKKDIVDFHGDVDIFRKSIEKLGLPSSIENCKLRLHSRLDFRKDFRSLIDYLDDLKKDSNGFDSMRAMLLIDITLNRAMSSFLCAKLIDLRKKAQEVIVQDSQLARSYHGWQAVGPEAAVEPGSTSRLHVRTRHAVSFQRPGMPGRFQSVQDIDFDEGLSEFGSRLRMAADFQKKTGRRLIVACSARGCGKGAQADRLISWQAEKTGGKRHYPHLSTFLDALGGYQRSDFDSHVVHLNLSFSNEIGPIIGLVIAELDCMVPPTGNEPVSKDQLELLERGLRRLTAARHKRLLIVLGNAGVLFDASGRAKSGQIGRVMRMLSSRHFARTPMDIMMYVGESQIPLGLRADDKDRPGDPQPVTAHRAGDKVAVPLSTAKVPLDGAQDNHSRRRLDRMGIRSRFRKDEPVFVHALSRSRVSDIAAAYFKDLASNRDWKFNSNGASNDDNLGRDIDLATGGSRFARTIILALLDAVVDAEKPVFGDFNAFARELVVRLGEPPSGSAIENAIEVVLDQWAKLHLLRQKLPKRAFPPQTDYSEVHSASRQLALELSPQAWQVATELLWHLSAFSHPVETEVLLACPGVRNKLSKLELPSFDDATKIEAMLELLTHWCLLFRIERRTLPGDLPNPTDAAGVHGGKARYRYAAHRHMQRHFLRLMGGRNVEATQWDQFAPSIYASMPDESPRLQPEVHRTLTEILQTLTGYPVATDPLLKSDTPNDLIQNADRIRAAYYLVRSTYSLGVVSHLTSDPSQPSAAIGACGHMEHYRRLVRWITHAAQYWEGDLSLKGFQGQDGKTGWTVRQSKEMGISHPGKQSEEEMGIFYPSELIWLYNECGVISLAQGKLQDAEQLLALAEQAARQVEADDSGSLHTRIRLHTAFVQFERGRPQRARQILAPIVGRPGGHPVPPLIASYYLGAVEHIGGNYQLAKDRYETALAGFRRQERSRATALVLMSLGDLERAMNPRNVDAALQKVNDAIGLAQQGDHEDVRIMATLAGVRIFIEAGQTHQPGMFEQLNFAQEYAARMDMPRLACDVHGLRARLLLHQGEYRLSAAAATASLEIAAIYDLKLKKARGLLTLAEIYRNRGEIAGARTLAETGRDIAAACDYYSCVRGFKELEIALGQSPRSDGSATSAR